VPTGTYQGRHRKPCSLPINFRWQIISAKYDAKCVGSLVQTAVAALIALHTKKGKEGRNPLLNLIDLFLAPFLLLYYK